MTLSRQNRARRAPAYLVRHALALGLFSLAVPASAQELPPAPIAEKAPAPAQTAPPKQWLRDGGKPARKAAEPVAPAPSSGSNIRIASLFALVAVLAGVALFLKRRRRGALRAVSSELAVITAARVGTKADVVIVDVSGRRLLLGVTEAQVTRLAWLDGEPDEEAGELERPAVPGPGAALAVRRAAVSAPARHAAQPARSFRETLLGALGRPTVQEDAAVSIAAATEDVVTRTARAPRAPVAAPAGAPAMVDVEGQARGLVLRLQKRV